MLFDLQHILLRLSRAMPGGGGKDPNGGPWLQGGGPRKKELVFLGVGNLQLASNFLFQIATHFRRIDSDGNLAISPEEARAFIEETR